MNGLTNENNNLKHCTYHAIGAGLRFYRRSFEVVHRNPTRGEEMKSIVNAIHMNLKFTCRSYDGHPKVARYFTMCKVTIHIVHVCVVVVPLSCM